MSEPAKSQTSSVEWIQIDAEQAGQRIDNFLLTYLKGAPRSLIYRILRKGEVRVNKGRIKPEYRIQEGDHIRIPPVNRDIKEPGVPPNKAVELIKSAVLYEDKRLLIINKPSGMAVHGGSGLSFGVIEAVRHWQTKNQNIELVHRLDRDTSGCLIIAKTRGALRQMHALLRDEGMDKRYLALVKGAWRGGEREVNVALQKNILSSGERMVRVNKEGKPSLSIFRPLQITPVASLVEIQIKTGRTHQVRVHSKHINHPVAGDAKYGDDEFNRAMRSMGLNRLFLHAWRLHFCLNDPEQVITVKAPLDPALHKVLRQLGMEFNDA